MEQKVPTKQGQIVRIINPLPDEDPNTEYLVVEDPNGYAPDKKLLLYSITEIQRTNATGGIPFGTSIELKDLHVIGEDLVSWVESWNNDIKTEK